MVKWSVHGRFVIASITSQLENEEKKENRNAAEETKDAKVEICRIKVWDSVNHTYVDDLARGAGMGLKKNTWVLAPHPINEEILMTGSDGGQLLLWNLQSKRILKKFTQYGVYSIDTYVMDNPLDGKFSPDGRSFLVGSQLGTISLFAHKSL
jgi:WD40 repeat protein